MDNSACDLSTICMGRTLLRCQYTGEDFLCGKKLATMETGGFKARLILTAVCPNTRLVTRLNNCLFIYVHFWLMTIGQLGNNFIFVQVEIEATVVGWRGDIAIDEILFTPGLCPINPIGDIAAGTIPTPPVPTTALIAMAPPYSKKLFLSKQIRKIVYHTQLIPNWS